MSSKLKTHDLESAEILTPETPDKVGPTRRQMLEEGLSPDDTLRGYLCSLASIQFHACLFQLQQSIN